MDAKIILKEWETEKYNTTGIQKEFILSVSTYYISNDDNSFAEITQMTYYYFYGVGAQGLLSLWMSSFKETSNTVFDLL